MSSTDGRPPATDHYATLQVARHADPEVIERAYRALAMKHHPDHAEPAARHGAAERMREINEAYRVLGDPDARRRYDASLTRPPSAWDRFLSDGLLGLLRDHRQGR